MKFKEWFNIQEFYSQANSEDWKKMFRPLAQAATTHGYDWKSAPAQFVQGYADVLNRISGDLGAPKPQTRPAEMDLSFTRSQMQGKEMFTLLIPKEEFMVQNPNTSEWQIDYTKANKAVKKYLPQQLAQTANQYFKQNNINRKVTPEQMQNLYNTGNVNLGNMIVLGDETDPQDGKLKTKIKLMIRRTPAGVYGYDDDDNDY